MTCFSKLAKQCLILTPLLLAAPAVSGCSDKEEILDIDTPDGSIEVERSTDTGEIDVDIDN